MPRQPKLCIGQFVLTLLLPKADDMRPQDETLQRQRLVTVGLQLAQLALPLVKKHDAGEPGHFLRAEGVEPEHQRAHG